MDASHETRNESKTPATDEAKSAQRCALIWFAVCCEDVLDALISGRLGDLRRRGISIDEQVFHDFSRLLQEKGQYLDALKTVHQLFSIQCSPPPCIFGRIDYYAIASELEKGLKSAERAK